MLITTNVFSQEKAIIAGENRFETSIEISKSWETSKEAILVNSSATSDMLCATVLSSQLDCPILLTSKDEIDKNTIYELKRLKVAKVYIIGGEDAINENLAKSIEKETINIERIYGKDRYETSINIADKINQLKRTDTIILLNENNLVAHAVSMSPVAGNKNIPVIICKDDNLDIQKEWIENNNIKKSYIIDGQDTISEDMEKYLKNEKIKIERIYGQDRYETNMKVIENFYKDTKINKVFYCKGEDSNAEIIDAMLISPLASKNNSPIILLGENLTNKQKSVIKKKNIKTLVKVGYGVSEEAKKELYKIKESYRPPSIYYPQTSKPQTSIPQIENIKPPTNNSDDKVEQSTNKEENLKYTDIKISEDKKTITITFNKDIYEGNNLKESIKIIIDPKNIVKTENKENKIESEEKYIKLNKYDSVEINKNELIIKLEDTLIGLDNSIVIEKNSIKYKDSVNDKKYKFIDKLRIDGISGEAKKIAFVKELDDFLYYINNKNLNNTKVNIIKLECNIEINESNLKNIKNGTIDISKELIIDGSNGQENFEIINVSGEQIGIYTSSEYIELKHLDLQEIYVYIKSKNTIKLKNMSIYLPNNINMPCITMDYSTVEVKELILTNDMTGIEVKSTNSGAKVSKLIIDGYVYNQNRDGNYIPSIIVKNKIITTNVESDIGTDIEIKKEKINEIIIKDNKHSIDSIYEIINSDEDNTKDNKIYKYYYKN